jgi:hypothetical protein
MTNTTTGTRLTAAGLAAVLLLPGAFHEAAAQASGAPAGQADRTDTLARRQQTAAKRLNDSVGVVNSMSTFRGMPELLAKARGVYIVPSYGRAAMAAGAIRPSSTSAISASACRRAPKADRSPSSWSTTKRWKASAARTISR